MKLEKDISFEIESAAYQTVISGVKGGGSYTQVFLKLDKLGAISINGVYYKKTYSELKKEKNLFSAQIRDSLNNEGFLTVNNEANPKQEKVSNSPDMEFDMQLKVDEAILHFTENGKEKYFKLRLTKKTLDKDDFPM